LASLTGSESVIAARPQVTWLVLYRCAADVSAMLWQVSWRHCVWWKV